MLDSFKQVLTAGDRPVGNYECRLCATPVDSRSSACPDCGSREIGGYEL